MVNLDILYTIELDRAKYKAGNIARILVDFSINKALLEAKDYENSIENSDY